ncbi:FUSC family protein [Aeromicrobium sp. 179-A 4D2 NHS]|uniref:FUSC family protein n=1 Tax=Aeromicrobium sp. 179-A 4D2 NHS TaxID=3142375 RepID=UPI0039A397F2
MHAVRRRLLDHWTSHPRIALALRAAVASAIAWILVRFVPGSQDYPYYAPFGAIIATTSTLAGSVRESLQSVGAIVVGGVIAWAVDLVVGDDIAALTIGLVVAISVSVAGWRVLGAMGGWAPTAAVFTLIIGHGEAGFIGAYGGLTLFGALIGILVNMLAPPLPLAPARIAVSRTRSVLAAQLRELAELMVQYELPTLEQWHREHGELGRARADMQRAVSRVHESLTANARARRHRQALDVLTQQAESLDRVSLLVSDVSDLVLRPHGVPGYPSMQAALTDEVREPIARAMARVSDALEAKGHGADPDPELAAADAELNRLLEAQSFRTHEQMLVHSVVLALRRALDTFE